MAALEVMSRFAADPRWLVYLPPSMAPTATTDLEGPARASVDDLRLAPFQVLAGEGKVHALTDHFWHLDLMGRLADVAPSTFAPRPASPSTSMTTKQGGRHRLVGASHRVAARGWS